MAMTTQRRYTPDDLLKLDIKPMPELVDGRLVRREPMGLQSDEVGANLIFQLHLYSKATLRGAVNGSEGGFQIFPDDPDRVRFPDVSFTKRDRLPDGKSPEGFGKTRPDLVAEVVSLHDRALKLRLKIQDYIAAKIPLILIVYPSTREVEVIRDGQSDHTFLKEGDTIDGGEALPGFSCPISALFDGI